MKTRLTAAPTCAYISTWFTRCMGYIAIGMIFFLFSCGPPREDISLYVMLNDTTFTTFIADQYNKSQRKFTARVRPIVISQLKYVVENAIQRENVFVIITTHHIPLRGEGQYFMPLVPKYEADVRKDALNTLGSQVMELTKNYGLPLSGFDVDNRNGISIATMSIPIKGYKESQSEVMRNFFQFISAAPFHAKNLMFNQIPIYSDATLNQLTDRQQERAGIYLPRNKMNTTTMQPIPGRFKIAP